MLNEQQLINKIKVYNNFIDVDKLKKAYEFAESAHATQKRHSGDPYISHPIAVANILAELRLDGPTITTALLHDTIEDTNITYQDVENKFGKEIADLVDGVTKLSKLENQGKEITLGENFRKLILATAKDIRVLLVKLADRLHNMRTISSIASDEKRMRIAKETMEIYSPLAERLGMHSIRDELEDLAFNVLNTEARSMIVDRIEKIAPNTQILFEEISNDILSLLSANKVFGKITGREKTPFSIWRKIQSKRVSLEQITDLIGFRISLGDRLMPLQRDTPQNDYSFQIPQLAIADARIIAVANGITQVGALDIVVINRGERDALREGDLLAIHQQGQEVKDPLTENWVRLPAVEAGVLAVFSVFERASFGLVLQASGPLAVGDSLASL